jgi:butyrate kinase
MEVDVSLMKDPTQIKQQDLCLLKRELKKFEKEFEDMHHRKPTLEDIAKQPAIGKFLFLSDSIEISTFKYY